jgi:competence protein ComEA
MLRKFSSTAFRIANGTDLGRKIARVTVIILLIATVDLGAREGSREWVVLENCRLIMHPANDGDSFHASAGGKEYLFRLYLVDTPETDALAPERLIEQSKYFGITVPQAIEVGETAKAFTREKLSQPFTVFTHMTDAMGRSKMERFYAFVQTKDGDLGEQLVRNGLGRNYGFKAVPPGLGNSRLEVEKLQRFEDDARQENIGGWGVNAGRLNANAQRPVSFSVFIAEKNAPARGFPHTFHRISAPPLLSPSAVTVVSAEAKKSHAKETIELGRIDINTATEKELRMVPGIGPVMAARIVAARPFRRADDLRKVNGIGDKKYTKIRPYFQ